MQTLFDGDDVTVTYDAASAAKDIVVFSFSGHGMHKLPNPRYGDGFLQKIGVHAVFFTAKDDHWWQSVEMGPSIAAANEATKGVHRRIAYGQSMGGFGAAAFAVSLDAEYLITAPQLSVLPARAKMHKVWLDGFSDRPLIYPDAAIRMSEAKGKIIYDTLHPIDTTHANLLKGLPGDHKRLVVPMASHFVPRTLTEAGVFSSLISDLILSPEADLAHHRRGIRENRLKSGRYVEMLIERLRQRKGDLLWRLSERAIARFLRADGIDLKAYPAHVKFLISYPEKKWGPRYGRKAA